MSTQRDTDTPHPIETLLTCVESGEISGQGISMSRRSWKHRVRSPRPSSAASASLKAASTRLFLCAVEEAALPGIASRAEAKTSLQNINMLDLQQVTVEMCFSCNSEC